MLDNWEIILRVVTALFLCGLIGLERQVYNKPAGLRTHALVGLGSAVFMLIALMLVRMEEGGFAVDASRIAAGVITGIGFIGAGTIIRSGEGVKGLTTAASIWVAAGIGMAAGAGYFFLATVGSLLTLSILFLFTRLERGSFFSAHKERRVVRASRVRKKKKIAREDF